MTSPNILLIMTDEERYPPPYETAEVTAFRRTQLRARARGQVKSMMSWLAYMKHGEGQETSMGIKLPAPNLQSNFEEQAREFADRLAESLTT